MINRLKAYKWRKYIVKSGLFDSRYYLFAYPDIRAADMNPIRHYILYGAKEGRNPSMKFNTNYYLSTYPDIDVEKMNPLYHYIKYGKDEGRSCLPHNVNKDETKRLPTMQIVKSKLNIVAIVPGGKEKGESSTYIRLTNPLTLLEDKINLVVMPKLFNMEDIKKFDVCIVQRNAIDDFKRLHQLKTVINNSDTKLVIDIDDALGVTMKHLDNPYMQKMHKIMNMLIGYADMTWYSTYELAKFYNNQLPSKEYIVPNALDERLWSKTPAKKTKSDKIRFVYMGTSTHDSDFYNLLYPAFQKLYTKYPDRFELTLIGALKKKPQESWIKSETLPNGFMHYPEFVKWFRENANYDIGLSPLLENDFNACKTDIKFLDYLGAGCVPMVSKVKAYNKPDIDKYAIMVENTQWFEALENVLINTSVLDSKKSSAIDSYLWEERSLAKNAHFMYEKLMNLYTSSFHSDCLISCWLGVDDILLDGLVDLENSLHQSGIKTTFVVSGEIVREKFAKATSSNIKFHPAIISRSKESDNYFHKYNHKIQQLTHLDALWTYQAQDSVKIGSVYAYWSEYIQNHNFKHIVIWGSGAPMSQLFISISQELGIEYTILERGHFSGTLLADSLGQLGFGNQQRQLKCSVIDAMPESYKKERMKEIHQWIEKGITSQYAEKNQIQTDELKKIIHKRRDKKVVLFLGAHDLGSGMKRLNMYPRANTWFKDTQDALNYVVDVLPNKFDDVLLVIKPHPSAKLKVSEALSQENYIFASDSSIVELIKNADVCITTTSTVLGYCVALGKPTLQFGITDSTNSNEIYDIWHPSVIASYLRDALDEQFYIEKNENYSKYVLELFDNHLIAVNNDIPSRMGIKDLSKHLCNRIFKGVCTYEYSIVNQSRWISKQLYEDIANRDRKYYDLRLMDKVDDNKIPSLAIVIPVYDDLEGLKRCIESAVKYREVNNNYQIVMIWDCGPREETLAYCREAKEKYSIDLIENRVNIGFSGTVNKGILKYKTHDIILLNSDTIVHSDWATRMQKTAYVDKEIGSVNPLSNNATLNNVPFPAGTAFPKDAIGFIEHIDSIAKKQLKVAVEAPVSHGFCVFIKRNVIDIIGLFDEQKFGKGHSEDNEYSMRLRSKGFKCITTTNVFIGHDGGTSFKEDSEPWKNNGRKIMREEFPYYFDEIRLFFHNDPISKERKILERNYKKFFDDERDK